MAVGGVIASHIEDLVSDEVFTGAIAFDDGAHHVLGYVRIICEKLLGVFRQTVTSITERGVVVVTADARVKADAFDDCARIKAFDFGVCVKFVEVADAEGKVCVGKKLDRKSVV